MYISPLLLLRCLPTRIRRSRCRQRGCQHRWLGTSWPWRSTRRSTDCASESPASYDD